MATLYVSTYEFEASHGKSPRGRGNWGFLVKDDSDNREVELFFAPHSMTYSDAKVWAKTYVRDHYNDELATGNLSLQVAP